MDIEKQLKQIRDFYDSLSDEELEQRLIKAGFNIIDEHYAYQVDSHVLEDDPTLIDEIAEIMDNYLETATPEQFKKDLEEAGVKNSSSLCSHCGFEIKSDYVYAINNNWCPACGGSIN